MLSIVPWLSSAVMRVSVPRTVGRSIWLPTLEDRPPADRKVECTDAGPLKMHTIHMQNTCQSFQRHLPQTLNTRHSQGIPTTCASHIEDTCNTLTLHVQDICSTHAKHMKTFPKTHGRHMQDAQNTLRTHTGCTRDTRMAHMCKWLRGGNLADDSEASVDSRKHDLRASALFQTHTVGWSCSQ